MRKMMILRGLPACGKSTFARELMKNEPGKWKRVNRDDMRSMLDDNVWTKTNESLVVSLQDSIIKSSLENGFNVIVDNTHLIPTTLKKLHNLAQDIGDVEVIEKCFNVSLEECIKRNASRVGNANVPEKVIRDMAKASGIDRGRTLVDTSVIYPARSSALVAQDESLPKAIICDLDGTLALIGKRSPYDASKCDEVDLPNVPVIETVLAMYRRGYKIIFMSGREDKYREQSVRFIEKYCKIAMITNTSCDRPDNEEIVPIEYELHMRSTGDMRKDNIVKRELFDTNVRGKYNAVFTLDDRNQVVDGWRQMGLTCFQVAPGNF